MHILNISPSQLLDLWDELHSVRQGTNTFGGDVIEFYLFRLMPNSPFVWNDPHSSFADEHYYAAACNLHAVCRLFEEKHGIAVEFEDGSNIDPLLDRTDLNRHRVRLKVAHRKAS
ncbi:hypothetical protein HFN89_02540 [Rhizobium laguerreae]|nr:hypothetical protein [Rhizobium laguerreae]